VMDSASRRQLRQLRRAMNEAVAWVNTSPLIGRITVEQAERILLPQIAARLPQEQTINGVPCRLEEVKTTWHIGGTLNVEANYKPVNPKLTLRLSTGDWPRDDMDEPPDMDDQGQWRGYG
jgi:hypothetical protein